MTSSQYSMAKVKLGTKSFSVDSEEIDASNSLVSAADCVAFCARLSAGDFKRLRFLYLVSVFLLFLLVFCFARVLLLRGVRAADVCGAGGQPYRRRGMQGAGGSAEGGGQGHRGPRTQLST